MKESVIEQFKSTISWEKRLSQKKFTTLFFYNIGAFLLFFILAKIPIGGIIFAYMLKLTIGQLYFNLFLFPGLALCLAVSVVYFAMLISQRLRDLNFPLYVVLPCALIPSTWLIVLWFCFLKEGTKGSNLYGDQPDVLSKETLPSTNY
jgi:uncharacterized membrane protein YhaH (DUF805 family)